MNFTQGFMHTGSEKGQIQIYIYVERLKYEFIWKGDFFLI